VSRLKTIALAAEVARLQKEGIPGEPVSIEDASAALETLSGYGQVYCKKCGKLLLSLVPTGFDTVEPLWVHVHRGSHLLVGCPDCHVYTRYELQKEEEQ